jgi:type VI secretion system FHA domain protein
MQLTLTVLRCPDQVAPETRTVQGGEYSVGRGPGVDWILPDPERLLSKRHFAVAYRGGAWQIADTSTNGTTMNTDAAPIGAGDVRTLRDGDRLKLGAYEIEVRLQEEAMQGAGAMGGFGAPPPARGASPFGDPFGMDPFASPPPARNPFDEPASHAAFGAPASAAQLPHDFDPLAPEPGNSPFLGPTQADHSLSVDDAFRPPPVIGQTPMHAGGAIPGDDLLPDDWDKDLLEGINPGAAATPVAPPLVARPMPRPAAQPPPQPMVQPVAQPMAQPTPEPFAQPVMQPLAQPVPQPGAQPMMQPVPQPVAQPVVQPMAQPAVQAAHSPPDTPAANPFDEPFDLSSEPFAPAAAPTPQSVHAQPVPAMATPFDEPFEAAAPAVPPPTPARSAPAPVAAAPAASPAADGALLTAFLDGAGMADMKPADPTGMMRGLGQAFRTLVAGLRAVLIARASIKSEFRIEQTMIRARGNNPLKFSAGDDDALSALLGVGRRVDMTPAAAVADALKDIRLHELASMAAMQSAVRTLLDGLEPAKLRAQADQGGGLSVLPAQRKARAWDAYEALHQKTVQALSDDFDSVFGKAFARAYERALDEVSARDRG